MSQSINQPQTKTRVRYDSTHLTQAGRGRRVSLKASLGYSEPLSQLGNKKKI